ncbi:MAG TPA: hypothetical protein VGN75_09325 [Kaistia sp.]|jgi:hypothetical protein|nr:hypothetical protein [Kaistia sp.]
MSFDEIPMKTLLDTFDAVRASERDDWLALAWTFSLIGLLGILALGFAR